MLQLLQLHLWETFSLPDLLPVLAFPCQRQLYLRATVPSPTETSAWPPPFNGCQQIPTSYFKEEPTTPECSPVSPLHRDRSRDFHTLTEDNRLCLSLSDRPSLSRTILLPVSVLGWLKNALSDFIDVQKISGQDWPHKGFTKLKAAISSNRRGRFLTITEFLLDHRSYTICVPHGRQASGWSFFLKRLPQLLLQKHTTSGLDRGSNHCQTTSAQQQAFHQQQKHSHSQWAWSDPSKTLRCFTQNNRPVVKPEYEWSKAIIC